MMKSEEGQKHEFDSIVRLKAFKGPELNLTARNSEEIRVGEATEGNPACCED